MSQPLIYVSCYIKPCPLQLNLILYLVLHSCYYPQYIQIKAAELVASDNFNEKMEQKFFSLYDKILNYRFPPSEGVDVCPQWLVSDSRRLDDFTTSFAIELNQHPLLLVEIKPSSDFQYDSGCNGAILQVLNCLDEIGPKNLHADRLYAISAIGKRWRACFSLKGNSSQGGQPVMGVTKKLSLSSAHPECWNPDITSDASYIAFQGIVDTIKSYIAQ